MSKCYKAEDMENLIINIAPDGEVFELGMSALQSLPTIEVSEDCISREYLKSFEYINKGDFNSVETIREWIDNAPSVVPSVVTKQSELTEAYIRGYKDGAKAVKKGQSDD